MGHGSGEVCSLGSAGSPSALMSGAPPLQTACVACVVWEWGGVGLACVALVLVRLALDLVEVAVVEGVEMEVAGPLMLAAHLQAALGDRGW